MAQKGIYLLVESYVSGGGSRARSKIASRVIESAGLKISHSWAEIRYPVAKAFVGSSPTPRTFNQTREIVKQAISFELWLKQERTAANT